MVRQTNERQVRRESRCQRESSVGRSVRELQRCRGAEVRVGGCGRLVTRLMRRVGLSVSGQFDGDVGNGCEWEREYY